MNEAKEKLNIFFKHNKDGCFLLLCKPKILKGSCHQFYNSESNVVSEVPYFTNSEGE